MSVLIVALLVVFGKLLAEKSKNAQINPLKKAIREQHEDANNRDQELLSEADINTTVGFLNRLHDKDPS